MSHNFVNENGYNVCHCCGEAFESHYWNKEQEKRDTYNRSVPIQTKGFKPNYKWNRLLQINKRSSTKLSPFVYSEILCILNLLPLSPKVKKSLYNYILKRKITTYIGVCKTFYKLICKLDLPLTTTEYIKILKIGRKHRFKPLSNFKNMESLRKYYWYINRQIEKAKQILNFSPEEKEIIYKIVLNYYNLIRFKMLKSSNPIYLIQNLVYYTIRDKLEPIQTKFNKKNFGIRNISYITTLVKYLKEVKDLKLDSIFTEKLKINKRNKNLVATL